MKATRYQAWRVIKKKHLSDALSGEGARLGGGRWNHVGVSVVYASETFSLAVLELFIHFTRRDITISNSLLAIPILIPDSIKAVEVPVQDLAPGWNSSPPPNFTRNIGAEWVESGASALLRVPSAIVPEEYNFVINVKHPDFSKITVGDPRPFALDDRAWK
jgi:RES domain-containing protein